MRTRILGVCAVLICFVLIGGSAWADGIIAVQNSSFETSDPLTPNNCGTGCSFNKGPVPDWSATPGTLETGSWQILGANPYFTLPLPDGNTFAYVVEGTMSQDLGAVLTPDTSYILSVFVGDRADGFMNGNYSIALDVNGVTQCTFSGSNTAITPGTFALETCSFETGSSLPPGADLSILLGSSADAQFDDVSVTAMPEPASILLLGVGLMFVGLLGAYYRRASLRRAASSI